MAIGQIRLHCALSRHRRSSTTALASKVVGTGSIASRWFICTIDTPQEFVIHNGLISPQVYGRVGASKTRPTTVGEERWSLLDDRRVRDNTKEPIAE